MLTHRSKIHHGRRELKRGRSSENLVLYDRNKDIQFGFVETLGMSLALKRTVAEFDTMVAKGAFDDLTQKIELIYGEIQGTKITGHQPSARLPC